MRILRSENWPCKHAAHCTYLARIKCKLVTTSSASSTSSCTGSSSLRPLITRTGSESLCWSIWILSLTRSSPAMRTCSCYSTACRTRISKLGSGQSRFLEDLFPTMPPRFCPIWGSLSSVWSHNLNRATMLGREKRLSSWLRCLCATVKTWLRLTQRRFCCVW